MDSWAGINCCRSATLLHANWFSVGARDPKLLHPEVKRGPFNPQPRSSAVWTGHHPPRLLENLSYVLSLDLFQSNRLRGYCVRGAPAALVAESETHSGGNRDRCEIRRASPYKPDFGWSPLLAGYPLAVFACCPSVRIPALAGHAEV